jgi:hypothetical protein
MTSNQTTDIDQQLAAIIGLIGPEGAQVLFDALVRPYNLSEKICELSTNTTAPFTEVQSVTVVLS